MKAKKQATSAVGKKRTVKRSKVNPVIAEREEWALLRPGMKEELAIAYEMSGRYSEKALVMHSSFGLGLVKRLAGAQKMEVLFEDGKKLLRCH